jgi:hypothetical protein
MRGGECAGGEGFQQGKGSEGSSLFLWNRKESFLNAHTELWFNSKGIAFQNRRRTASTLFRVGD